MYVDAFVVYTVVFLSGYLIIQHGVKPIIRWIQSVMESE